MKLARRRFLQLVAAAAAAGLALPPAAPARERPGTGPKTYLTRSETVKLHDQIAEIPADLRAEFERRYRAWRNTWDDPALAILSDTAALRRSAQFAALTGLGPPILPLLIAKLAHPQEFFALQAYEVVQPDWPANIATDGQPVFESEQAKARRAVKEWLAPPR
jgi:hypothetical protein